MGAAAAKGAVEATARAATSAGSASAPPAAAAAAAAAAARGAPAAAGAAGTGTLAGEGAAHAASARPPRLPPLPHVPPVAQMRGQQPRSESIDPRVARRGAPAVPLGERQPASAKQILEENPALLEEIKKWPVPEVERESYVDENPPTLAVMVREKELAAEYEEEAGLVAIEQKEDRDKSLPVRRTHVERSLTEVRPRKGRLTEIQAVQFFRMVRDESDKVTSEQLAEYFDLDLPTVHALRSHVGLPEELDVDEILR